MTFTPKLVVTLSVLVSLIGLAGCSSEPKKDTMASLPKVSVAVPTDQADKLQQLNDMVVVVDSPSQALLNGDAQFAISGEKWSDSTMGEFLLRYGHRPVMTIITAQVNNQAERDAVVDGRMTLKRPWYLYSNFKGSAEAESLQQVAAWLYSEEGQEKLAEHGLVRLPEPLLNRGRVKYNLQDPLYKGGYR
ncbi:hypothetical protein [Pseudomaricurvus sp.]|uniref:hypothetical protein n=1 Tax=Pseudomaricurvus sp. TaxID=2004510 RepID=UPI003F6C0FDE